MLKKWNGRPHGKYFGFGKSEHRIYVAAHSVKQAAELVGKACECTVTMGEINNYYNKCCWGNSMEGIKPTEPCVYVSDESKGEMINGLWKYPVTRIV